MLLSNHVFFSPSLAVLISFMAAVLISSMVTLSQEMDVTVNCVFFIIQLSCSPGV